MASRKNVDVKGLADNLRVGICRYIPSEQGRFLYVNYAFEEMLGVEPGTILNMQVARIFESMDIYGSLNDKVTRHGYIRNEEIQLKRADGRIIWCSATVTAVKNNRGEVKWFDGVVEDISASKRVEKELLESKELFRVVFDNSAVAITVTDENEKIVAWNPFAGRMLEMRKADLFNKPVKELYPPKEWKRIRSRRAREKGVLPSIETKVMRKDGTFIDIHLSISVLKDSEGNVAGAIGIMRDITSQKIAEKRLKESEKKIRVILDNSAAAITLINEEERIVSWNKFTEQLLGVKKRDLYMKPVSTLYPKEEWQKIRAANIRKIGSKHDFETKVIRKDKTILNVSLSVNVLKDSEDNIIGSVGIMQDITERKKVEKELIQAKMEAEEANQTKSLFLANVSHEVRTPMNAIIGMVDMTLDTTLTDEQKENLNTVKDASGNLLGLLNDILDLSRVESGKVNLEIIEFNLRDIIKNVCRGLHVLARNKNLDLLWNIDPSTPNLLLGDPIRLRQVIINFVNNAIKFTGKGKIELNIKPKSISDKECVLLFSVSDTGIGIPKDKQDAIFDVFVQADDSITRRYGGTGLGLAISKRLVELMKGRLWLESTEGKGSTFYFTASLGISSRKVNGVEGEIEKEGVIKQQPKDDLPDLNILVAEDNLVSQKIITKMLTKKGWTVYTVDNGQDVLGQISKNSYDIILMDVQMPVLDGLEATKLIREGERQTGTHIPIVALTARAMEEDKKRCIDAGMDGYVSKPIDRLKFFEIIRSILKKG